MDLIVLRRDPRTIGMCFGWDVHGRPQPVTESSLRNLFAVLPPTERAPDGVQALLQAARDACIASLVSYNVLPFGVLASLHAIEAALRAKIELAGGSAEGRGRQPLPWRALWDRAVSLKLIAPEEDGDEDIVETGRRVRNMFSHPKTSMVMPYAMALPMIITSHRVVARLFPALP
ncbi:hypothetical protein [Micromonospora sp. C81]|uniref:hypothetical protein n=1 Tax=Micromonospora sp. C81 TaxID=2824881 RepID=UPI001B37F02C|nr:hypothetical protein [Micromonospora sp. C81]MBQ1036310.1 hypothetical protein [Micromonospora sp. C81]